MLTQKRQLLQRSLEKLIGRQSMFLEVSLKSLMIITRWHYFNIHGVYRHVLRHTQIKVLIFICSLDREKLDLNFQVYSCNLIFDAHSFQLTVGPRNIFISI